MGRLTPNEERDLKTLYQVIAQKNALDGVDLSNREAIYAAISKCLPEKEYRYFLALNTKKNKPDGELEEDGEYLPKKTEQPKNVKERSGEPQAANAEERWETERKKIHALYRQKTDPLGSLTYGKAENDLDAENEVYIRQTYKVGNDGAPQYWNFENDLHCLKNIFFAEEKKAREEARESGDPQQAEAVKSSVPAEPDALPAYAEAYAAADAQGFSPEQERSFLLKGIELLENEHFHPDKILAGEEQKKPGSARPVTMEHREAVYRKLRNVMRDRLEAQKKEFGEKTPEQGYKDLLAQPGGLEKAEHYRWMTGLSSAIEDLMVHNRVYNAKNDLETANRSRKALEKYMDSKIDGFYVGKTNHYELEQEYENTRKTAEMLQESYKQYLESTEKNLRLQYEADVKRLQEEKAALDAEKERLEDELIKRHEERLELSETVQQERETIDLLKTAAQEEAERNEALVREKFREIDAYEKQVLEGLRESEQESYDREVERINNWFLAQGVRAESFRREDAASFQAYSDIKAKLDSQFVRAQQLLQKHSDWFSFRETFSGEAAATGVNTRLQNGTLYSLGDRPEDEEQIDERLNEVEKALIGGNLLVGSILDLKKAHQQNRLRPEDAAKELATAKVRCFEAVKRLEELYPDNAYRSGENHNKLLKRMQNAADEEEFYDAAQALAREAEEKRAALVKDCGQRIRNFEKKLEEDNRFVFGTELQEKLNETGRKYAEAAAAAAPEAERLKEEFAKLQSAHINNGIMRGQLERFRAVKKDQDKYHQLLASYVSGGNYDEIAGNPNDHIELKEAIVKSDALEKACKAEMLEIARKTFEENQKIIREDTKQQLSSKIRVVTEEVHKRDENGETTGSVLYGHSAALRRMLDRRAVLKQEITELKEKQAENLKKTEEKLQELTDRNKKYEADLAEGRRIQEEYKELKARAEIQNGILNIELPQMEKQFFLLAKQEKDIRLRYGFDRDKKDELGFIDPDRIHQFSGRLRENAGRDLKTFLDTAQAGRGAYRGSDSRAFREMTDSLREALGLSGKPGAENVFERGSLTRVKEQLEKIQAAARAYTKAKENQDWWHLFRTDMRRVRLGFAKQLENYAKGALQTLNGMTGEKGRQYGLTEELCGIQESYRKLTNSFGSAGGTEADPFAIYENKKEKYKEGLEKNRLFTEANPDAVRSETGEKRAEVTVAGNPVAKPEMQAFMDACLNPKVMSKAAKCKGNLPFRLHCYIEKDKQKSLEESLKLYNDGMQKDGQKKENAFKSFFRSVMAVMKY